MRTANKCRRDEIASNHVRSKASDAVSFARLKWTWLDNVAADHGLTPAAFKLAFVLASRYLNSKTGECWPAQATLAADIGMSERQVRSLLAALVEHGHLLVRRSGKGASNRYRPVLYDRQHPAGHEETITGNSPSVDRKNIAGKTGRKLPPNPLKEPFEEPDLRQEIGESYKIEKDEEARMGARSSPQHKTTYEINEEIEVPGFGLCEIERVMGDRIIVRSEEHGDTIRIGRNHSGKANVASAEVIEGD